MFESARSIRVSTIFFAIHLACRSTIYFEEESRRVMRVHELAAKSIGTIAMWVPSSLIKARIRSTHSLRHAVSTYAQASSVMTPPNTELISELLGAFIRLRVSMALCFRFPLHNLER